MTIKIIDQIKHELYCGQDPYSITDESAVDHGYPHTNLRPELVDVLLGMVNPSFWLEVGSMLGNSAIVTAERINEQRLSTEIVCIDPFCGDVNMWAWEAASARDRTWRFLNLKNGHPTIYNRFLANVVHSGFQSSILPIPCTSIVGFALLRRLHSEQRLSHLPEIIYLDSAHQEGETFLELQAAWDLLAPGGILFGDDWSWGAVRHDVSEFATDLKMNDQSAAQIASSLPTSRAGNVLLFEYHWILCK